VVLMSATINTDLYRDYFAECDDGTFGPMDCLSVGVKRYPVEINFLENLLVSRSNGVSHCAQKLLKSDVMTPNWVTAQYSLVVALLLDRSVCKPGTGVLVFISGMDDITAIATLLEPHRHLLVCPLHSLLPEEEQDLAFEPAQPGTVKVVLATNAAESSVTIPDCDVVICLGTHKTMTYNETLQRTQLTFCMISKASATQRAGRTGRIRPGVTYRLYTEETHAKLQKHELAEVLRRPLEDVILSTWIMLEEAEKFSGVTPFLQRMIEAPTMTNVERSYESLCDAGLITFPSDDGSLSAMGRFTGALPVDLALGRMLAYGVLLGVAAEAVVLAAAMSLSRPPYRFANPIFHDPEEYNALIRTRMLSEVIHDQGDYSEPIALLRLLQAWRSIPYSQGSFCHKNNLQVAMMKQFNSSAESLAQDLSLRLRGTTKGKIDLDSIGQLSESKINTLRLIMTWSFSENLLTLQKSAKSVKKMVETGFNVTLNSAEVTEEQLTSLLGKIPFEICRKESTPVYMIQHRFVSSESNAYRRLANLVDSLARVGIAGALTECFCVTICTSDEDVNQLIFVALPGATRDTVFSAFHESVLELPRTATSGEALRQQLITDCASLAGAEMFTCLNATAHELARLSETVLSLKSALEMTIPLTGKPWLRSIGSPLDPLSLAIIFGEDNSQLAMRLVKNAFVEISFPAPELLHSPLIEDLPLGHRVIHGCRSGRESSLVLKVSDPNAPNTPAHRAHDVTYKAKHAELCEKIEVPVVAICPVWESLPTLNQRSRFSVRFPRQGMLSCSLHCGAEPLFAVAHSTLPVTKLNGTIMLCSGITFLPLGDTWLQMAMRATGKDHTLLNMSSEHIPQELLDLARDINCAIQDAESFQRRDDVISLVEALRIGVSQLPATLSTISTLPAPLKKKKEKKEKKEKKQPSSSSTSAELESHSVPIRTSALNTPSADGLAQVPTTVIQKVESEAVRAPELDSTDQLVHCVESLSLEKLTARMLVSERVLHCQEEEKALTVHLPLQVENLLPGESEVRKVVKLVDRLNEVRRSIHEHEEGVFARGFSLSKARAQEEAFAAELVSLRATLSRKKRKQERIAASEQQHAREVDLAEEKMLDTAELSKMSVTCTKQVTKNKNRKVSRKKYPSVEQLRLIEDCERKAAKLQRAAKDYMRESASLSTAFISPPKIVTKLSAAQPAQEESSSERSHSDGSDRASASSESAESSESSSSDHSDSSDDSSGSDDESAGRDEDWCNVSSSDEADRIGEPLSSEPVFTAKERQEILKQQFIAQAKAQVEAKAARKLAQKAEADARRATNSAHKEAHRSEETARRARLLAEEKSSTLRK